MTIITGKFTIRHGCAPAIDSHPLPGGEFAANLEPSRSPTPTIDSCPLPGGEGGRRRRPGEGTGRIYLLLWLAACSVIKLHASTLEGKVFDPSGRLLPATEVSLLTPLGAVEHVETNPEGRYQFTGLGAGVYTVGATAPGFSTRSVEIRIGENQRRTANLHLQLSAVPQRIVVSASLGGALATQVGSSVTVISRDEIEDQGDAFVLDALRQAPGVSVNRTGREGGVTGVFIRGGASDYNLVMLDGIPLDEFGGGFDFAPLLADGVDRVEVDRGPESALFGANAVAGVVNIVTEQGEGPPQFSFLAEGGSFSASRFSTGGSGLTRGWSWGYNLARLDTGGIVPNDQYRDQAATLSLTSPEGSARAFTFHFYGNANDAGAPGPFGSDPDHLFTGIDRISRDKQNLFALGGTYSQQLSPRFRQVTTADLSTNDYYFRSPFGDSFSNSLNGLINTRSEIAVSGKDRLVAGAEYNREQIKDTFIARADNTPFLLPRASLGFFVENRWSPISRLYLVTGVRLDDFRTHDLPADPTAGRPLLPAVSNEQASPRVALAYLPHKGAGKKLGLTRLHASFGTGIRMPNGFELAFTNNGRLQPERSRSFDVGLEQRFFSDRAVADVTYFYNRFEDQIVVLGGSLTHLSTFTSANFGNSRAQGVESSFRVRPRQSLEASVEYTRIASALLALDGTNLALQPFRVGQPLLRVPRNAAAADLTWRRDRWTLNTNVAARGATLDLEPNLGTYACQLGLACLFNDKGYILLNGGFSYQMTKGVELYGQLNNILDRHYEESFGFPALTINFLAGIRLHFR